MDRHDEEIRTHLLGTLQNELVITNRQTNTLTSKQTKMKIAIYVIQQACLQYGKNSCQFIYLGLGLQLTTRYVAKNICDQQYHDA